MYSSSCSNASWSNQSRLPALSESMTIETTFNGLGMSLGNLSLLSAAQTRSISAENFDGSKGRARRATERTVAVPSRELGQGWKVSPSVDIPAHGMATWRRFKGRCDSTHVDDDTSRQMAQVGHPNFLGWRRVSVGRSAIGRLLLQRVGTRLDAWPTGNQHLKTFQPLH